MELIRVKQWIKNLFVFTPLFFSFHFHPELFLKNVVAFLIFSLAASSVYIFNDIKDVEEDRKHPVKRYRPLASGRIKVKHSVVLMVFLLLTSLITSFILDYRLFLVLTIYVLINILYSTKLKHISIIDLIVIAVGFDLRLLAGSITASISLSNWIVVITFLLAVFLAASKRREDFLLYLNSNKVRRNIDRYNLEFLNATMVFMASVIVVSYIMYTVSDSVVKRYNTDKLYLTSIFVILGILRYMQITFVENKSGNPTEIVINDRFLQIVIVLWLISFFIIVRGGF
ncbi:MAG: decaprenyl-phosphate phosphoribosyltransferase [Hydrogenothermaceae bacterium]|nr:decaprenyl-phosphate phosphoribosyltransferase [Hydrogenothermaceae bacterium]